LDALIGKIDDAELADALRAEVDSLKRVKEFGLVFERHLPETVLLYSHPIRRGAAVRKKTDPDGATWMVKRVAKGEAVISRTSDEGVILEEVKSAELVVIRAFGEPIYPGLKSLECVSNDPLKPWHIVINAENYHALESLLY
jgi:adenine-specific DNA-methyltransferase